MEQDPSVAQRIVLTLEACAATERSLTLKELVGETRLPKTTLHRTCWKLVELGLLEHSDDGFSIGMKVFALGNSSPVLNAIRVAAVPFLLELQQVTHGMSNLAVLHDGKALVIDALYTPQPVLPRLVGGALPLHCTAVGKAIVASLETDERERLLGRRSPPACDRADHRAPDAAARAPRPCGRGRDRHLGRGVHDRHLRRRGGVQRARTRDGRHRLRRHRQPSGRQPRLGTCARGGCRPPARARRWVATGDSGQRNRPLEPTVSLTDDACRMALPDTTHELPFNITRASHVEFSSPAGAQRALLRRGDRPRDHRARRRGGLPAWGRGVLPSQPRAAGRRPRIAVRTDRLSRLHRRAARAPGRAPREPGARTRLG